MAESLASLPIDSSFESLATDCPFAGLDAGSVTVPGSSLLSVPESDYSAPFYAVSLIAASAATSLVGNSLTYSATVLAALVSFYSGETEAMTTSSS